MSRPSLCFSAGLQVLAMHLAADDPTDRVSRQMRWVQEGDVRIHRAAKARQIGCSCASGDSLLGLRSIRMPLMSYRAHWARGTKDGQNRFFVMDILQ